MLQSRPHQSREGKFPPSDITLTRGFTVFPAKTRQIDTFRKADLLINLRAVKWTALVTFLLLLVTESSCPNSESNLTDTDWVTAFTLLMRCSSTSAAATTSRFRSKRTSCSF